MGALMTAEQQSVYKWKLTSYVTVTLHSICVQVKMGIAGCAHIRNVRVHAAGSSLCFLPTWV